ncbi:MAG: YitT family protein, partial [Mycoplasmataceae bacterium]|nr:YitT family protein [Mycoplasmataceae bacterium]
KEIWPIFLLAAIGAIFMGFSMAYMWKLGGSTGGVNFIVYYYSTKKKLSIGFVAFIVSIIFVSISFGVTIPFNEESRKNYASKVIATILYMAINLSVTNLIYPKYTKTWFEIHTTKKDEVEKFFFEYNHSYQTRKVTSGYTKKEKTIFTLAVFHLESKSLKKELLSIDKDIWISIIRLKEVIGHLSTQNID